MTPKQILEIWMSVVADKSLILVTLLLNFVLFGYAMLNPTELRIIAASLFSLMTFNPILKGRNNERPIQPVRQETEGS